MPNCNLVMTVSTIKKKGEYKLVNWWTSVWLGCRNRLRRPKKIKEQINYRSQRIILIIEKSINDPSWRTSNPMCVCLCVYSPRILVFSTYASQNKRSRNPLLDAESQGKMWREKVKESQNKMVWSRLMSVRETVRQTIAIFLKDHLFHKSITKPVKPDRQSRLCQRADELPEQSPKWQCNHQLW